MRLSSEDIFTTLAHTNYLQNANLSVTYHQIQCNTLYINYLNR